MAFFLTAVHVSLWLILIGNLWYLRRRDGSALSKTKGKTTAAPEAERLSVLIPARNEEGNLQRLLPSLLAQGHSDYEVIVYDDGSTDGTADVLHATEKDFRSKEGPELKVLRGDGPPPGWLGKTHALHQAAERASGDVFLFLDADAHLEGADALQRLVQHFRHLPSPGDVLTGFPRLRGGALLLVSLVPFTILSGLPWPLVRRTPGLRSLGALNGQCWMVEARTYRQHRPHEACKADVLEDVNIGRFFKAQGHTPVMRDVQEEVSVFMYDTFGAAWRGFRKNAYLLMGGTPPTAVFSTSLFLFTFVLAPFFAPWLWPSVFGLKAVTDWRSGQPLWLPLLAPLSFVLAVALQVDSTVSHFLDRVTWKGRQVGR